jgi:hypothetical protein
MIQASYWNCTIAYIEKGFIFYWYKKKHIAEDTFNHTGTHQRLFLLFFIFLFIYLAIFSNISFIIHFLASLLKCFWHRQCLLCCTCTRNLTTYLKKNCAVSTKVVYFCLPVRNCSPFRSTPKLSLYNNITVTRSYSLECYNSLKQEYKSTVDTKGVIKICKLKDRQQNGKKKRDKRTNNDLRNIT